MPAAHFPGLRSVAAAQFNPGQPLGSACQVVQAFLTHAYLVCRKFQVFLTQPSRGPALSLLLGLESNGLRSPMIAAADWEKLEHLAGGTSWARLLPRDGDSTEEVQRKRRAILRVLRVSRGQGPIIGAGWQQLARAARSCRRRCRRQVQLLPSTSGRAAALPKLKNPSLSSPPPGARGAGGGRAVAWSATSAADPGNGCTHQPCPGQPGPSGACSAGAAGQQRLENSAARQPAAAATATAGRKGWRQWRGCGASCGRRGGRGCWAGCRTPNCPASSSSAGWRSRDDV